MPGRHLEEGKARYGIGRVWCSAHSGESEYSSVGCVGPCARVRRRFEYEIRVTRTRRHGAGDGRKAQSAYKAYKNRLQFSM